MTASTIMAYANRQSARPGDTISFKVSSRGEETYRCDVVRLRSPDVGPGPDTPPFDESVVDAPVNGHHPAVWQPLRPGSHGRIPDWGSASPPSTFTLCATIRPTLVEAGRQAILGTYSSTSGSSTSGLGASLVREADGTLALVHGVGGRTAVTSSPVSVAPDRWTLVAVTFDARTGAIGFHGVPIGSHRLESLATSHHEEAINSAPELGDAAIHIGALHASDGTDHGVACFNGRIERPRIFDHTLTADDLVAIAAAGPTGATATPPLLDWDLSQDIGGADIRDVSGSGAHGVTVNLPTRGVAGSNWSGDSVDWRTHPAEYGAIHFHEDDILDAGWRTSFALEIPAAWDSGCYAVRLRMSDAEFYVPFMVRTPADRQGNDVAFLVPTATYAAYANLRIRVTGQWNELIHGRLTVLDDTDLLMLQHPELGLSTYDSHTDGSAVVHSSMHRPLTNFRPKGRIYKFCQDLLIVAWLEHEGIGFDVLTDEDLHREGVDAIAPYRVLVTSSHPEYYTTAMMDGVEAYVRGGGRLMYLGGNGFHHRIAYHPTLPGVVEVRRPDAPRLWAPDVSQGHHTFTGEPAGTWTGLGRAAQQLVGVGFITQGFDACSYYRRSDESHDERVAFMFDGIDDDIIGDFGLLQGGAAGYEIDRASDGLGTPSHALVVASSENHSNLYDLMVTSLEDTLPVTDPSAQDRIRADMVFFETPGGGAVFSVGSIAWSGSLSHAGYTNNVAHLSRNVLDRFLAPDPFEVPHHV